MIADSLGIIGGGQLGAMLADAARGLGYKPDVLTEPIVAGEKGGGEALRSLARRCALVAFESELVPPDALDAAQSAGRFLPEPSVLAACADKLGQKLALEAAGLPTAAYAAAPRAPSAADAWLASLRERFPRGCVLKWARGAYDGKGNLVHRFGFDDPRRAAEFVRGALVRGAAVYAEELIDFAGELAVVSVRTASGDLAQYPVVWTRQENGVCVEVRGPAESLGLPRQVAVEAATLARRIGEGLRLVGTYAVELFLDRHGRLLVNEIAPRVHNSGHFTLDAAATSQFANHWRALLGGPLGATTTAPFFAMVNVLGPDGVRGPALPPAAAAEPRAAWHWYGKAETRPWRKLGHATVAAASPDELEERLRGVRAVLKNWERTIVEEVHRGVV